MTTAEMYRLPTAAVASTAQLAPNVTILCAVDHAALITSSTTDDAQAHLRAMRELAALSFDPGSLDRESTVDIWGFREAE
jgi:hypothetical protein